jgi:hypothetical protein
MTQKMRKRWMRISRIQQGWRRKYHPMMKKMTYNKYRPLPIDNSFRHIPAVRGHPSVSLPLLSSPTLPLFICITSPHLCTISRDYT